MKWSDSEGYLIASVVRTREPWIGCLMGYKSCVLERNRLKQSEGFDDPLGCKFKVLSMRLGRVE
jgi:hypothetical protein